MKIQKTIAYQIINDLIQEKGLYSNVDKNIDFDLPLIKESEWEKAEDEKKKILDYYLFWNEHNLEEFYDVLNIERRIIYLDVGKTYNNIPLLLRKIEYKANLIDKKHLKDKHAFEFEPKLHLCYKNNKDFVLVERI